MTSTVQSISSATAIPFPTHSESNSLLQGRGLTLARALWALLLVGFVALFVLGIPNAFARASIISPETAQGLQRLGLSADFPAYYWITTDAVTLLVFTALAVFIVLKRPDDWMVMLTSLTLVGTAVLYTDPATEANVPIVFIALAFALVEIFQVSFVYLFPNGRFVPRGLWVLLAPMFVWRPLIWALTYMPNYLASTRTGENYGTLRQDPLDTALMVTLFVIGVLSQIHRYRRVSNPSQRQQTKWLLMGVIGAVVVAAAYVTVINALGLLQSTGTTDLIIRMIGRTTRQVALSLLPLTLTFSILRYRLWDIDVIIRRTLVYVPLSAILAGMFAAGITFSQRAFVNLTGAQSDLATVLTTLVVVAAFEPIKRALQAIVDRTFKEAPDPEKQLRRFGEQVRYRVSPVQGRKITRRFLEEAVRAYNAKGGIALYRKDGQLVPMATVGTSDAAVMSIVLQSNGQPLGAISLGARGNGEDYAPHDARTLQEVAGIIATAIDQDQFMADDD